MEITSEEKLQDIKCNEHKEKPHCCPVCWGKGTVVYNFYDNIPLYNALFMNPVCRSCNGNGIVWR